MTLLIFAFQREKSHADPVNHMLKNFLVAQEFERTYIHRSGSVWRACFRFQSTRMFQRGKLLYGSRENGSRENGGNWNRETPFGVIPEARSS